MVSAEEGDEPENTDGEIGDLFVDRLLFGNLPCRVSHARPNKMFSACLIVDDGFSEFIDQPCHLPKTRALIYEQSRCAFRQQFPRLLFDRFQLAAKMVDYDRRAERSSSIPGQLRTSIRLRLVHVICWYIHVQPEQI